MLQIDDNDVYSTNLNIDVYESDESLIQYQDFQQQEEITQKDINKPDLIQQLCITGQKQFLKQNENFSVYITQGGRSQMEDSFSYLEYQNDDNLDKLYACFDGHTSAFISEYLSKNLLQQIINHALYKLDIHKAIHQVFQEINNNLIKFLKESTDSGSTAIILIIRKTDYVLVNLGDSIACIIEEKKNSSSQDWNKDQVKKSQKSIIQLNNQHRTSEQLECDRIEQQGGWILKVKNEFRVQGQLQITRSFGDYQFQPYISSVPDINFIEKNDRQTYIIVATDGFWDVILNYKKQIDQETVKNQINDLFLQPSMITQIIERNYGFIKDNLTLTIIKIQ